MGRHVTSERTKEYTQKAWDDGQPAYVCRLSSGGLPDASACAEVVGEALRIGWKLSTTAMASHAGGVSVLYTFIRPDVGSSHAHQ